MRGGVAAVMLALAGLVAGCSGQDGPPRATAERFAHALDHGEWATACALLAKPTRDDLVQSGGKSCPSALAGEAPAAAGPIGAVRVYGSMAEVRTAQDTWFLAEYARGWRVLAADCSPDPGHPYDCRLKGA